MTALFWILLACASTEHSQPGDIVCGEGTRRAGEICVPIEDTGADAVAESFSNSYSRVHRRGSPR